MPTYQNLNDRVRLKLMSRSRILGRIGIVWFILTLAVIAYATRLALFIAPTDALQGNVFRIFFYHVPTAMLSLVKFETVSILSRVEIRSPEQLEREEAERRERLMRQLQAQHAEAQSMLGAAAPPPPAAPGLDTAAGAMIGTVPFVRGDRKVGRNELCPCGSGKKFKHCHGALAEGQ